MRIPIKTDADIARMRVSGRMAAQVLDAVVRAVRPGIRTRELEEVARDVLERLGARSAFLGYRGYPALICVSINDEVVHGIPGDRVIQAGDVVSVDCGVVYEGWYGDTARTVTAGDADVEALRLIRVAEHALAAAIEMAVEGHRLGDVQHVIQHTVESAGFHVVREFVGHGIGRALHEEPQIPNYGVPNTGPWLRRGMTLAIEPMVTERGAAVRVESDGWTVRTLDGGRAVHVEHTVAVGVEQAEILTRVDHEEWLV